MSTSFSSSSNQVSPPGSDVDLRRLEQLLNETIPPLIREARAAFCRDLPGLLQQSLGRWVGYSGQHQLSIGSCKTSVYQDCLRRGLKRDQFLVLLIDAATPVDGDADVPLDVS